MVVHITMAENASETDQSNRSVQATSLESAPLGLSSVEPHSITIFYI